MLRVTFEMIPFGDEEHKNRRVIGALNIGSQSMDPEQGVGNYLSTLITDGHFPPVSELVKIEGHERRKGAFELALKVLKAHLDPDKTCEVDDPQGQKLVDLFYHNKIYGKME